MVSFSWTMVGWLPCGAGTGSVVAVELSVADMAERGRWELKRYQCFGIKWRDRVNIKSRNLMKEG